MTEITAANANCNPSNQKIDRRSLNVRSKQPSNGNVAMANGKVTERVL